MDQIWLSEHFSLAELCVSQEAARRGWSNTPPPAIVDNMRKLAAALEQVRALLKHPISVSSGYRSENVNAAIGGVPTSAHCKGWAADIICPAFGPPLDVCKAIAASDIAFDQLIHEYSVWAHFSVEPRMRYETLTIAHDGRGYRPGLLPA